MTGFVLPLCVSTFKLNTPISDLIGPLFLAALMGASLSTGQIAAMALVAVATVPILLLARREEPRQLPPPGDPDNIFENELRAD